jgi:hypothetical protein
MTFAIVRFLLLTIAFLQLSVMPIRAQLPEKILALRYFKWVA